MMRTIIPIPPIQCVKLLQKSIDFGIDSISINIDDPVVVKPETDSKIALTTDGMDCENR